MTLTLGRDFGEFPDAGKPWKAPPVSQRTDNYRDTGGEDLGRNAAFLVGGCDRTPLMGQRPSRVPGLHHSVRGRCSAKIASRIGGNGAISVTVAISLGALGTLTAAST